MAKPAGPRCNLQCLYCFYTEKDALFGTPSGPRRMTDTVLESFVRQYIGACPATPVPFAWQGGEPTLMGLDFFRRAVELQQRYAGGRAVENSLQTNGLLLDDAWCEFLARERFLVGLSLDGPAELHDRYRRDRGGQPSHARVMEALGRMVRHGVEFNTLTCVTREGARRPLEVYRFLRDHGVRHMQFIPIVERRPDAAARTLGLDLAGPLPPGGAADLASMTSGSVDPRDYGEFLVRIFDEWVRRDVGAVFVNHFEVALGAWAGHPPALCTYARECGNALVLEHNGDLYACDHYVYPEFRRGNILEQPLDRMVAAPEQAAFGRAKWERLTRTCRACPYVFACHGECPKHRLAHAPDGEAGHAYLCRGLRRFYRHAEPYLGAMADLMREGHPAALIMRAAAAEDAQRAAAPIAKRARGGKKGRRPGGTPRPHSS